MKKYLLIALLAMFTLSMAAMPPRHHRRGHRVPPRHRLHKRPMHKPMPKHHRHHHHGPRHHHHR